MTTVRFAILSLIIMLISPSAGAVNLTGTWAGKFTCTGFDGANFSFVQSQPAQSLRISQPQSGNCVTVQWFDGSNLASTFTGFVIDNARSPQTKGHAAIGRAVTKGDITSGVSEIVDLNATMNPSKGKGSLTGKSIYADPAPIDPNLRPEVTQCKWSFKLVDTADPGILASCPQ